MAVSKMTKFSDIKIVPLQKTNVSLVANTPTDVSFSAEIEANKPSGYTFGWLQFKGGHPQTSWTNAIVTETTYGAQNTYLSLNTLSSQNYIISVYAIYVK